MVSLIEPDGELGNAWTFTSKQPAATIDVGVETRDSERVFFIRDNGAGFSMAHAFRRYGDRPGDGASGRGAARRPRVGRGGPRSGRDVLLHARHLSFSAALEQARRADALGPRA